MTGVQTCALPIYISHDIKPEVGLSAGAVAGMSFVQMRFIGHLDPHGGKCSHQLLRNRIAGAHFACAYGSAIRPSRDEGRFKEGQSPCCRLLPLSSRCAHIDGL